MNRGCGQKITAAGCNLFFKRIHQRFCCAEILLGLVKKILGDAANLLI